jgi:hypothetical protein
VRIRLAADRQVQRIRGRRPGTASMNPAAATPAAVFPKNSRLVIGPSSSLLIVDFHF